MNMLRCFAWLVVGISLSPSWADSPSQDPLVSQGSLVYQGTSGIGQGKHVVLIANDHEYRSEQTCPLMAKMLAKHFGFRCTVLFGLNDQGEIQPGATDLPGMEALEDADLLFFFTRFMNLPDSQVDHLVGYFERGGPVVGVRTSTHPFNGQTGKWAKLNTQYEGDDYRGGLGEQIFGNTWHKTRGQSHYGTNHVQGSRITAVADAVGHPILSGVDQIHAYSGAYESKPPAGSTPLVKVQVLNTFDASDQIDKSKPVVNAGWTRDHYVAPSGEQKDARVVYTSFGASEDLLDADARRFLINACLWAGGWDSHLKPDLNVDLVGKYSPTPYTNGAFLVEGVRPSDLEGFDSEIMPADASMAGLEDPDRVKKNRRILASRPRIQAIVSERYPKWYGSDSENP